MGRRWKDRKVIDEGDPPGSPTDVFLILPWSLSIFAAAGPVEMWETRLHAFSIFPSGRFPFVSFCFFFFLCGKRPFFRNVSTEASVGAVRGGRTTLRWKRWGCGSWGARSLVDTLAVKCRPHRFRSSARSFGMVLCGAATGSSASRHDPDGSGCRPPEQNSTVRGGR